MAVATAPGGGAPPPLTPYQRFLQKLHHPEAAELLKSMKIFVRSALTVSALSVDELAEATREFYVQTESLIASHPLWEGCDHLELGRAADAVEKFVMTKLHDRVFAQGEGDEEQVKEFIKVRVRRVRRVRV